LILPLVRGRAGKAAAVEHNRFTVFAVNNADSALVDIYVRACNPPMKLFYH
jgi:hypothetical protein